MGLVEMDEFGDRQIDFAVWDMTDIESGEFQVKYQTFSNPVRYVWLLWMQPLEKQTQS